MVTSARKTSKREKEFAFSSPIGTSYAELCVQSGDSRFQLNDYSSFDGMTIGVLKANSRNDDLAALAQEKGFTYQMAEYDEEAELTEALHNGEVDGIVASSLRKHVGEKIVARFALEEFYVIVRKEDTDLLNEINKGIEQMDQNEGDWRNKLYYKYTTSNLDSTLSFTEEEQDYIRAVQSGEKVITACAQPDRNPYSYVENGKLVGIIPEYFDYLMEMAEDENVLKQDLPLSKENLTGVKILLAEDNDLNAEIAAIQLEEYGMKVIRAVDGRETVEVFKNHPSGTFNIILMDVMMPEMNGHLSKPIVMEEVVKTIIRYL